MALTKAARRREAKLQADDAATWKCETCETIIESGKYCWPCGSYWSDVDNGMFADDWEPVRRDMDEMFMRGETDGWASARESAESMDENHIVRTTPQTSRPRDC